MVGAFESFEFVFVAHLMYVILGYTNELSECLQRREQDILNAISLVNVAKRRLKSAPRNRKKAQIHHYNFMGRATN